MDDDKIHYLKEDRHSIEPLLPAQCSCRHQKRGGRRLFASILVSVVVTLFCSTIIFTRLTTHRLGTFASGFGTELAPARSALRTKTIKFSGTPQFSADGRMLPPLRSDSAPYMGAGHNVDDAWDELIRDRYFLLSQEEARDAWGSSYAEYWNERGGGYIAGLDVMHTLHCLNYVRMALYPMIYSFDPMHREIHQDHCINQLRQAIMCSADLTPIPSRWHAGIGDNYIDADQRHTCRDYSEVRRWVDQRSNGSLYVQP